MAKDKKMVTLIAHVSKENSASGQDLWARKEAAHTRPFYNSALYKEGPHMLIVDSVNPDPNPDISRYPLVLFRPIAEAVLDDLVLNYGWEIRTR